MDTSKLLSRPIFFERNRVGRVYTGGKLFSGFFGDAPEDSFLPEEWLCSTVRAINKVKASETEGLSVVRGESITFDILVSECREEMLGKRRDLGVLVKLLDSAVRLPAQAHPNRAFSKKHFNSEYGKVESWLVVDTREDACVYYGFKDKITKAQLADAVTRSETDKNAMAALMNCVPVKKGDIFIVNAGIAHAIGAGCLMLETQEPTDFTIQPEVWCDNYRLNDYEMYIGLDKNDALDCFDFETYGEAALSAGRVMPETLSEGDNYKLEALISEKHTPCFSVDRITLSGGEYPFSLKAPSVCVATDGEGELVCEDGTRMAVKKGDYFFMPFCLENKVKLTSEKGAELVVCLPPRA